MYIVRDIFHCRPGMAKELVKKFKQSSQYMDKTTVKSVRILTDAVANYWTVILEIELESLSAFENMKGFTSRPEVKEIMKDYMTLVESGKREIFFIEQK